MEQDSLLFWLSLALPLGTLMRESRRGWVGLCGLLLVGNLAARTVAPDEAVSVAALASWAVLVAAPALLARVAGRAVARQDYGRAHRISRIVRALHPLDGWPGQVALYGALALAQRGRWHEAEPRLRALAARGDDPVNSLSALGHLCRWTGDWRPLADGPTPAADDPPATAMRVRALGECGRPEAMADLFAATHPRFADHPYWSQALVSVFAFAGRPAAVALLGRTVLAALPPDAKTFWEAVARLAAGGAEAETGRAALERLTRTAPPDIAHAAALRLATPTPEAPSLPPDLRALLDRVEADLAIPPPHRVRLDPSRIPVTLALMAVLVAVFGVEIAFGGSEDGEVLFRLGALWPQAVVGRGQWWRLGAAMFLHAGFLHLAFNLLGLLFLGRIAEPMFGRVRFAILYALTGLGSMAAVVVLMRLGWAGTALLVGASGALMGLAGVLAAAFVARAWGGGIPDLTARVRAGVVVLVLQGAMDLTTPHVSFAAHLSGFAIGALLGLVPRVRRGIALPASVTAPSRDEEPMARRGLGAYVFLAGVLGAAVWLRSRPGLERGGAGRGGPERGMPDRGPGRVALGREPVLSGPVVAGLRRLRFVFVGIEAGAPAVDPEAPFGSPDALADLAPLAKGAGAARDLYVAVMAALPLFCERAYLAPGRYPLPPGTARNLNRLLPPGGAPVAPDGAVPFRREHAALIAALRWETMDPHTGRSAPLDPRAVPPRRGEPWPVTAVSVRHPYGDRTAFKADMADALGFSIGREAMRPDAVARLDRLHGEMHAALQVFVLYATVSDGGTERK